MAFHVVSSRLPHCSARQPWVQLSGRLHEAGAMGGDHFIRGDWGWVTGTWETQCSDAQWAGRTWCDGPQGCTGDGLHHKGPWLGHGL